MAYKQHKSAKRRNNWERLEAAIEWLNMTPNFFAMHIGLTRAEHLYHIKRGNFGITKDMATRITRHFPEISRTWLLTGAGNMLISQTRNGSNIPYYEESIETLLPAIEKREPTGFIDFPLAPSCDIIVKSSLKVMTSGQSRAAQLFLRHTDVSDLTDGEEYVFLLPSEVTWCKMERVGDYKLRLTTLNGDSALDRVIDISEIVHAWLVIAKMEILVE